MIKVYFPQGCYGTYLSRCIYSYTNLRKEQFKEFLFGKEGDSHQYRFHPYRKSVIDQGHLETMNFDEARDSLVVVLPHNDHRLDYYNNQFAKQEKNQLISYILNQLTKDEIEHKLKSMWNYDGQFDSNIPNWIMREWCSFWISDVLTVSYDSKKYTDLNSKIKISTVDLLDHHLNALTMIAMQLNLTLTIDTDTILRQHNNFLSAQKFHNSQKKCYQYVKDCINGNNTQMLILNIFEESYIQHLLRQYKFEISCDGLNVFPESTQQLAKLIYKV